jgi:predicted permease
MLRDLWNDVGYRVRALLRRGDVERELRAELADHLSREAARLEGEGLSPEEARRQARLTFGGVEDVKERSREARGTAFVESLALDVRYAIRGLRARPAFAFGVALTLALGIGANAAMFGIVDRLLLRSPAYVTDVGRVHRVYFAQVYRGAESAQRYMSIGEYLDLMRETSSFQTMAAWATQRRPVGDGVSTKELFVSGGSAAYFDLFDARPVLGRGFTASEDRLPTGTPVAVLGYTYWQVAFGGSRDVVGQTLRVGATPFTIVGVAPKDFTGMDSDVVPAVYVPLSAFAWDSRPEDHVADYHWHFLQLVAKRKLDVAVAAATDDLSAALNRSWIKRGRSDADRVASKPRAILGPLQVERGPLARPDSQVAAWVGGVAAIVLLIACANVASLLLARAVTRGREIAMRLALGVSFARLTRQLFVEGALLASVGGAGALLVAQGIGALVSARMLSADAPPPALADPRTVAIILLTTALAAIIVGVTPVLYARRTNLVQALGGGNRHTDTRASRARAWLLAAQLSLSVALLIGAGLFVRSFQQARGLHLGYDVDPIVVVSEHRRGPQSSPGEAWHGVEARLTEAAARLPGAVAASPATSVPFWGFEGRGLSTDAKSADDTDALGNFLLQASTPDYFRTMGTRIVRGRGLAPTDRADSPQVVVVSDAMGKALWSGQDPIGRCLYIHGGSNRGPCRTVVGVAEDAHAQALEDLREFMYYVPIAQYPQIDPTGTVLVRVSGHAQDFVETVRLGLQPLMPGDGYVTVVPFSDMLAAPMRSWRLGATMFVAFGVLALIVASVGLYSVVAYGVAQRTREIAIRLALGATRQSVLSLVLRGGLKPVVASVATGCAVALAAARWMAPLLFHVSPRDPFVYAVVTGALIVVAVIAMCLPARAATRVDPNSVLRAE